MAQPFAPPGTKHNFTADRSLRVVHARLELDLDLPGKRLAGAATLTLASRSDALAVFTLDAVEMEIEGVAVDGRPAAFDYDGEKLRVTCERPFAPPGTRHNFTADRSLRVVHARLELDLDLPGRRLAGAVQRTSVVNFSMGWSMHGQ